MTRKTRLILLMLFALILALFILFLPRQGYSAGLGLMTPQEAIRYDNNAIRIAVSFFILIFLNTIFYLLAKFNLKNSTQINKIFWPNFEKPKKLGEFKLAGETEPFTQIELQDTLGNRLNRTITRSDGNFCFYVQSDTYVLSLTKFGFQTSVTDPIKISGDGENNIRIKLKPDEMIAVDSPLIALFTINQKFWAIIFILSLICAYLTYPYLGPYKIILILLTSPISLWIYLNERNSYLKIMERSGEKIADTKVKILNHKDEKLDETTTDRLGKIKIIASRGFYKIFVPGHAIRTLCVKEKREIVNLKLKI